MFHEETTVPSFWAVPSCVLLCILCSGRSKLLADNNYLLYYCREKLQLEIAARERAEKKQQEYEERLRTMQEEMEKRQQDLAEAQDMIRRLEEQLKQLQAAKEELEVRQNELQVCLP